MLVVACVSSHGFGHGSRTAAVLTVLNRIRPHWRLVLSTMLPPQFLRSALGAVPFEHRPCQWDVGVVQADALGTDPEATLLELQRLHQRLPDQLDQEAAWIRRQQEPVLLIGDVPPAAALLAQRCGAPLVWLASFGWDGIYAAMGASFSPWVEHCRQLYGQADLLLQCPLSLPMDWAIPRQPIGLTAAEPRDDSRQLLQALALPEDRERCVLVSFGGLGYALDPQLLRSWPEHVFLGHDPVLRDAPNGRQLPATLRPVDVMGSCGRVLTKPGYSTFCEAMTYGLGIHMVQREGFAEAPVLEQALQRHGWHRVLRQSQFRCGDWQLDQPLLPPRDGPLPQGGAVTAAEAIASLAERHGFS